MDAVIAIKSLHKNREFRSATQYECRLSYFTASVTLEGRIVKLAPAGAAPAPPEPAAEAPPEPQGFRPAGG